MMIRVNLLGARRGSVPSLAGWAGRWTDSRGRGMAYGGILLGALAMLGVLGLVSWKLKAHEADLAREIGTEVADSLARASEIARIGALAMIADSLESRIQLLHALDGRRERWPRLLNELGAALPGDAWLVEITSVSSPDSTPDATILAIRGAVTSTASIAEYIRALEQSRFVADVSFESSTQETIDGRSVHRFTLGARYEEPAQGDAEQLVFSGVPR